MIVVSSVSIEEKLMYKERHQAGKDMTDFGKCYHKGQ